MEDNIKTTQLVKLLNDVNAEFEEAKEIRRKARNKRKARKKSKK